jgi:predicted membrane chloride channel (bestrophin family)
MKRISDFRVLVQKCGGSSFEEGISLRPSHQSGRRRVITRGNFMKSLSSRIQMLFLFSLDIIGLQREIFSGTLAEAEIFMSISISLFTTFFGTFSTF